MWSAWSCMMRTNWRTTAGSRSATESRIVVADPLMEVRGILSSWLTMARNSARSRSDSLTSAMSCMVTTIDSICPSSEKMGVAFSSRVRLRPSGTLMTTSSARAVSPDCSASATGNSLSETTRPSARRKVSTSRRSCADWSGSRKLSTIRRASRLKDLGNPVAASKTATPTGEVSTRVSRSFLALCSSQCLRALAMARAAWEANSARVSSSSRLNSCPASFSARKTLPTRSPRCRTGKARKATRSLTSNGGTSSGRPSALRWPSRSGTRRGPGIRPRYAKCSGQPGMFHSRPVSSGVIPEARKSPAVPSASCRTRTP